MKSQGITKRTKVFVGVSGGVDSSVALALLQQATPNNFEKLFGRSTPKGFRGYDVTGVFLKVWNPSYAKATEGKPDFSCEWREERRSAMRVCATLGVPFMTLDCEAEYKKEVVDYMIREYSLGRVPNPDIFCNKYVKFGVFLDKALALGADFVATGHYAQVLGGGNPVEGSMFLAHPGTREEVRAKKISSEKLFWRQKHTAEKGIVETGFNLIESVDKNKDQSYFLYTLNQHQLSHTLFPVGGMTKPDVRKLAEEFGLPTATKKDSQGLCFIGKVDMKEFLSHYIETSPGNVLDTSGNIIGYHDGALLYAIGERHGFTITQKSPHDSRMFVVSKDMEKNIITVADTSTYASGDYSAAGILIKNFHFISGTEPDMPFETSVRIRYRQEKQQCVVSKESDGYHCTFNIPQQGVSLGQSAVFYDGDVCIGGGIIDALL
jgi:tRNA-specific 2-thiouridylase